MDLWDSEGKLSLTNDLTMKEVQRAKKTFPGIQIIEDKPEPKKSKKKVKVEDSEDKKLQS